jgi:hypothetical protein
LSIFEKWERFKGRPREKGRFRLRNVEERGELEEEITSMQD